MWLRVLQGTLKYVAAIGITNVLLQSMPSSNYKTICPYHRHGNSCILCTHSFDDAFKNLNPLSPPLKI